MIGTTTKTTVLGKDLRLPCGVVVTLKPCRMAQSGTVSYWAYPLPGYGADVWTDAMVSRAYDPGIVLGANEVQLDEEE